MRLIKQKRKGGEAPIPEHLLILCQLLFLITAERCEAGIPSLLEEEVRAEKG